MTLSDLIAVLNQHYDNLGDVEIKMVNDDSTKEADYLKPIKQVTSYCTHDGKEGVYLR